MDQKILGVNDNASPWWDFWSVKVSLPRISVDSIIDSSLVDVQDIGSNLSESLCLIEDLDASSGYCFTHLLWNIEDIPINFRDEWGRLFFSFSGVTKEYFIPKVGKSQIISNLEKTLTYRMKQEFDVFKLKNIKFSDLQNDGSVEISYKYDGRNYAEPFFLYNFVEQDLEAETLDIEHISREDYFAIQDTFIAMNFDKDRCKDISIMEDRNVLKFSMDGHWMYFPFFKNTQLRENYILDLIEQLESRWYIWVSHFHFKRFDLGDINFNVLHFSNNSMFESILLEDGDALVKTAWIWIKWNHSFAVID